MTDRMKAAAIQIGPYPGSYEKNWKIISQLTEEVVLTVNPDLVVYSELMTAPYFAPLTDPAFFAYAEEMNGETVRNTCELAAALNVHIIGTLFEKAEENGETNYYNTAFVCSPSRGLLGRYRKVHLPHVIGDGIETNEKFYFEARGGGGNEFPVFTLDNGFRVGILICFDRSFPEAWKSLSVQGTDIIVVPTATYGFRKDLYVQELRVRAMENNVYVLAVNKAGEEALPGEPIQRVHFGNSCLIYPDGEVAVLAGEEGWTYITGELARDKIQRSRARIDWTKERKPKIYQRYLNGEHYIHR